MTNPATPACACGAARYEVVVAGTFDRLGLSGYPFTIARCIRCGLARTIDTQYARGYAASTEKGGFVARDDTWSAGRAAWVRARTSGRRLLDVGCNVGELVAAATALGFDAEGIDVDPIAVAAGRELGCPVSTGPLEEIESRSFDVEHVWHFTPRTLVTLVEEATPLRAVRASARGTLEPRSRGLKGFAKSALSALGAAVGAGDEVEAVFHKPVGGAR